MWTGFWSAAEAVRDFVFGPPMAFALLGVGAWFTVRLGFFQFRHLPLWLRHTAGSLFSPDGARGHGAGSISQLQSVTTALAATVGTGNIAGVAAAIAVGGPGSVFWMWCAALLGMMTAFAENALGIRYRVRGPDGRWQGGPMGYMERGLGAKWLAYIFAVCCVAASFGVGALVQSNSIAAGLHSELGVPPAATGAACAALALAVSLGGVRRIGRVTEYLVPGMVGLYLLTGLCCLAVHLDALPDALRAILREAFTLRAGASGTGCGLLLALRTGVARGAFSNEAGLGSTVLVHAQADVPGPAQQGMWAIFEVMTDTLLVCTMTALVILTSGVYDMEAYRAGYASIGLPGGPLSGVSLTAAAFSASYGAWGGRFVALALVCFAFSTVLGWSWYGRAAAEYVFGARAGAPFEVLFAAAVLAGSCLPPGRVWTLADLGNGLMAIPNLIAIVLLTGEAAAIKKACLRDPGRLA